MPSDVKPRLSLGVNNPPKFWLALVFMVIVGALMALERIASEAGVGILTFIAGYIFGNGVAARRGEPVEPIVAARTPDE